MTVAPYFTLALFNDRCWVEIASSGDRDKLDRMMVFLIAAGCTPQVVRCANDSDAAIAAAVDHLPPPRDSFAAMMDELEADMVGAVRSGRRDLQ